MADFLHFRALVNALRMLFLFEIICSWKYLHEDVAVEC